MPNFVIKTTFKGVDRVSSTFARMTKGADKFGNRSTRAFNKATRSANRFNSVTKSILAAGAVQRGVGLLTRGIAGLTSQFIDFDHAILGAAARFKDIGPDSANFEQQLRAIQKSARAAGFETEKNAAEAARALDFLARAGFTSTEAMGSLRSMLNLTTATGEDFAAVADMSSDLLGAFGMNADNTAQKIANLNRLNDVLVKSTNSANVTVSDMFETMKQVGPVATGILGGSLEEVAALTSVLGNSGIKGSEAMTALKNAYLRLASPTSAASKLLKSMNLTLDDGSGNAKKMTDFMSELGTKLKGLGTIKQAEILNEIFGKRAIAGGKNLIDNIVNIRAFEKALLGAGGTAEKTAQIMRGSIKNQLAALASAATEAGFKLFDAFTKDGKGGIKQLTEAVRGFDMGPVIKTVRQVVTVFKVLFSIIKPLIPLIPALITGWLVYTGVMKTFLALGVAIKIFQFVKALKFAAVAQWALNAAMSANPIGLVIVGIAGLIAVGVVLFKNWDTIKTAFSGMVSAMRAGIGQLWGALSGLMDNPFFKAIGLFFAPWLAIPSLIIKAWTPIKSFFAGILGLKSDIDTKPAGAREQDERRDIDPPNRRDIESRQQVQFQGQLDISGAPEGSKVKSKTSGAPPVAVSLLGASG